MTFTEAQAALEAIRNLPIERLNERQPMLVALAAAIVNAETQDGQLTQAKGNWGLESMDYWQTLAERMRDVGFVKLGNGHFSAAYEHALLRQG
uniref:Serine/threonine kinase n=1 Tax=Escherichia phage RCF TaxID=3141436 RepID=A0AAU6SH91_9CAUD